MSGRDAVGALLSDFGRMIGIPDLEFDAANRCVLLSTKGWS
jgi:hypothetical protein